MYGIKKQKNGKKNSKNRKKYIYRYNITKKNR